MMEESRIIEILREKNTEKRFIHSMGVKYMCAALAMRYGYDVDKACICGLLHDNAKHFSDEKLLSKCKKYDLEVTEAERKAPYLLHGKVGAYIAAEKFGVEDEEILDAITYHTTGRPDMTLIGKILFLADYIEPSRRVVPGLEKVRRLAFEDIDMAVYEKLRSVTDYLEDSKDIIDDLTMQTKEFYEAILIQSGKITN